MNTNEVVEILKKYGADIPGIEGRFMGDMDLYVSCMRQFMEDPSVSNMGLTIDHGEYQEAFEAAHTLKGMAGNMGLTPFYKAVCDIVEALRNQDYSKLNFQYSQIMIEFSRLKEIVQSFL